MQVSDQEKFLRIKGRVRGMLKDMATDIENNAFVRMSTSIIPEMAWLCREINRLTGVTGRREAPPPPPVDDGDGLEDRPLAERSRRRPRSPEPEGFEPEYFDQPTQEPADV